MITDASRPPEVSVVLAVYNAGESVVRSIESVLTQEGPNVELIVVDDGSTDDTPHFIESAMGPIVEPKVLCNETNLGLTESLIRGCALARGRYIARIDAGDRYLPGRIESQFHLLESRPDVGLVSCGTRFLSAENELLYAVCQQPQDLSQGLSQCELDSIRGPSHHGSTMFRRSVYEAVGGYRAAFRVAQDLDLWLRISEVSGVLAMPEVLYESTIAPGSISIGRRELQIQTAKAILEGARRRRAGEPEPEFHGFPSADAVAPSRIANSSHLARYEYFVGSCLLPRDRLSASKHFLRAWSFQPWNFRYGLKFAWSLLS